jgi:hypothetical protein
MGAQPLGQLQVVQPFSGLGVTFLAERTDLASQLFNSYTLGGAGLRR